MITLILENKIIQILRTKVSFNNTNLVIRNHYRFNRNHLPIRYSLTTKKCLTGQKLQVFNEGFGNTAY